MTFEEAKQYLLSQAQTRGVDAEILAAETRELTLGAFEGQLAETTQATQGGIGIRVVTHGKTGYAYTEERTHEALDWALTEAIENAELQEDIGGFLPAGQALGRKDLLSEGLSAPIEEKAQLALSFEQHLRQDPRYKQASLLRYTEWEDTVTLASTQGISGDYRNGSAGLFSWFVMQQGDSLKEGSDFVFEHKFHKLEPGRTALAMLERTGRHLGAKSLKTGRYTAYLEPKALAQLLSVFLYMLNGKTVLEGKSRLADKLGQAVTSDAITLIDDPTLSDGLKSRPFDSEGTPARPVTLLKNGILKSFLHNSETAHKLGQDNTGHASRSYKGTLGVSATNVYLQPGSGIKKERGIIVTDLMGVHAGANPVTGDISLQTFGLLVEGGEIAYPVENFVLSGNLLDMLKRVTALGTERAWEYVGAYIGAPMIEIPDMSFAGA